jgi:hypothetical protein
MRIPDPTVEVSMKTIAHVTRVFALCALLMLVSSLPAHAALSLASLGYSQDFNSLATSGTPTWTDNSTIAGWYSQTNYGSTTYQADDGSSTNDDRKSYGSGTDADRALGHFADPGLLSGDFPRTAAWGVVFQNDTGGDIFQITVNYTGEQWRQESVTTDRLDFSYGVSSSDITDFVPATENPGGIWTPFSALDFLPPQSGSGTDIDGNDPANSDTLSQTINVSVPNGSYLALRWFDPQVVASFSSSNQQGMAIDDFSITAAIPEPSAFLFGGLVCGVIGVGAAWRRLVGKAASATAAA